MNKRSLLSFPSLWGGLGPGPHHLGVTSRRWWVGSHSRTESSSQRDRPKAPFISHRGSPSALPRTLPIPGIHGSLVPGLALPVGPSAPRWLVVPILTYRLLSLTGSIWFLGFREQMNLESSRFSGKCIWKVLGPPSVWIMGDTALPHC